MSTPASLKAWSDLKMEEHFTLIILLMVLFCFSLFYYFIVYFFVYFILPAFPLVLAELLMGR